MKHTLTALVRSGIFFILCATAGANDYHVSNAGDDANPGTEEAPWKTIAKVNSAALAAGDTIRFRCGDLWRETLVPQKSGGPTKKVTYTSYGTGAKPVISGAETVTTPWTPYPAGPAGTYTTPLPKQTMMVIANGAHVKSVKLPTSIVANRYSWADGLLYLNIGIDPNTALIEVGQRANGVSPANGRDHVTLRGLRIEKTNISNIRVIQGSFWIVEDCEIYFGNSNSVAAGGGVNGDQMHDAIIRRNHIAWSLGDGVMAWRSARVEVSDNLIENVLDDGGSGGADGIQIGAKVSTPNACDGFKILNNVVSRPSTEVQKGCIIQEMGDNGIIAGNTCIKGRFALACSGNNNIVEHNYVTGFGTAGGLRVSQDQDMYGMKIRYNVVSQSPGFAGITILNDEALDPDDPSPPTPKKRSSFEIYNNVVYNTYYGIISSQPISGSIRNNIVWSPSTNPRVRIAVGTIIPGEALVVSNNILRDATTETMASIAGSRWLDLPAMQAAGWGAGSTIADPLFQNVAAADFRLKAGSPGINAGVDVGLPRDFDGTPVPIGSLPDIGAYEYGGADTSRLVPGAVGVPLSCRFTMPAGFAFESIPDLPAWAAVDYNATIRRLTVSGTPTAPGEITATLRRADGTAAATLRFHIMATFTDWQRMNYSTQDLLLPEISGPAAIQDGLPNLIRFALGMPAEGTEGLPACSVTGDGSPALALTYTRDRFADAGTTVEVSGDLLHWRSGGAFTEDILRVTNPDGTETITTRDLIPANEGGGRFMRLRASR